MLGDFPNEFPENKRYLREFAFNKTNPSTCRVDRGLVAFGFVAEGYSQIQLPSWFGWALWRSHLLCNVSRGRCRTEHR